MEHGRQPGRAPLYGRRGRGLIGVALSALVVALAGLFAVASASAGARAADPPPVEALAPDKLTRPDGAIPGVYHIDYLNDLYQLDPTTFPIDGSIGFWVWSALNPAQSGAGAYNWTELDNWIKQRVDRSTTSTGVGVMISTYDATANSDILATPNWVIKLNDAVIPATTQSGVEHYIDYYHRTRTKHLNGEFDTNLSRWTVSNSTAITFDPAPPADTSAPASNLPERPAEGPAVKLGGANNVNATLVKDASDALAIPAMPPSLNGKQNVYVQVRVHLDKATADPNDHLYMELWDAAGNKLGGTQYDINATNFTGSGPTYWQEYRFNVTSFATEKGVRAAFRVVTNGANPTTFWIDNVQLRVRHLIPKYWGDAYKNAYKSFINALGARYKTVPNDPPLNGDPRYALQFVAMGTGVFGESQPTQDTIDWEYGSTFDHVIKGTPDKGMDTTGEWVNWVKEITLAYATAFASGDGTGPARHLLLQYAASFMSSEERGYTTEYAAGLGVGISHNRLNPEFTSVYRNDKAGFYDPIRLYWNTVPVAVEAYSTDLNSCPTLSYWAIMGGVEKHADYIRTDPDLLRKAGTTNVPTTHVPFFEWAGNYLGKTVQNAPKVWTVMREHSNPSMLTCATHYYQSASASSSYPQYGNYNYWLEQVDTITGGKTVAETNNKGADQRYARDPVTGAAYLDAGLGNCPSKAYSDIYVDNPPACNPQPYNPDLPALEGQNPSDYTDFYNATDWAGGGKEALVVRRTDQATNNSYMFFKIDDGYMFGPGDHFFRAAITVKYFDIGTDKFSLKYDSSTGEKVAGTVTKAGSKQLKTVTFTVTDAAFANRLAGGSDFYLDSRDSFGAKDGNEWVHMVEVENLDPVLDPTHTPTATATPSPSPTASSTPTATPSATPSLTPTPSQTPTASATPSLTPTPSVTPSRTPSVTPSPTFTPTPTTPSQAGDPYEADDLCASAREIGVDGTVQRHTFHKPADTDWVYFNAVAGVTYQVRGDPLGESAVDLTAVVHGRCAGLPLGGQGYTFSRGINFPVPAQETGRIFIQLRDHDADAHGADFQYEISVRAKSTAPERGALIIVAGKKKADAVQTQIRNVAAHAHSVFVKHGYHAFDHIYYLAPDLSTSNVDAVATHDNVAAAILQWAAPRVGPDRPLTLYLVDHGVPGVFLLDEARGEALRPEELDEWLSTLEAQHPGLRTNIIIEACYSGSFVERLSGPGRVVITSTSDDASAWASEEGAQFSDVFIDRLDLNDSLYQAFQQARHGASVAVDGAQVAWLDDNGDGAATAADGVEAQRRGFTYAGTLADDLWPPYIAEVLPPPAIQGASGELRARVLNNPGDEIDDVWAVIYPPSYQPPPPSSGLVRESPTTVLLMDQGDGWYGATYRGFTERGAYRVVVFAEDGEGLEAQPVAVTFGERRVYLPLLVR